MGTLAYLLEVAAIEARREVMLKREAEEGLRHGWGGGDSDANDPDLDASEVNEAVSWMPGRGEPSAWRMLAAKKEKFASPMRRIKTSLPKSNS